MQYSTNFNMNKPERAEQYNIDHWNANTDIIDAELEKVIDGTTTVAKSNSANILATTRKINSTDFNGSTDITTTKWGTSRNIKIQDNDGTNTETIGVDVDGSENKILKLPANIKVGIDGGIGCIVTNSNTITSAPPLKLNGSFKLLFTSDIAGSNTTTPFSISYNGNSYPVKICKNGTLENFYAYEVATNIFKYLQAYTTIEIIYDGTNFILIGNPIVLSSANYTIYADGQYENLSYSITEHPTGRKWIDGKPTYMIVFSGISFPSSGTVLQTNIDTLIQQYGNYSNSTVQISLPYNSGDTKIELRVNKNNNNLYVQHSNIGGSIVNFNFIAEYTKT